MKLLLTVALLLVLNSAYLAARAEPSVFYYAQVALHVALGLAVAVLWLRALRADLRPSGRGDRALAALVGAALLTGVALTATGATRPFRALLYAHVGLAVLATLAVACRVALAAVPLPDSPARNTLLTGAVAALLSIPVAVGFASQERREAARAGRIVNPPLPPASMDGEGDGPRSPFFPSSATTTTGQVIPATFFMTSESCARCHPDIYAQWKSSAHHLSSFNNQWYRKSIEYMQDVVGTRPSKWCAGCHDHAVFFNGRFDQPIKEQIDTPEAQNGLGCLSCHAIVHVGSTMGQGDFQVEYPPLHDLAVSENPLLQLGHDALLRLDPEPHRKAFLKPFHREQSSEFCSACHKVHLDGPVNAYRWLRGFNEYDNWQASGVSGQGARSFYSPKEPLRCADCHMPLVAAKDPARPDGRVHSHRFPAANTALPVAHGDAEQLRVTQEFLSSGAVSLDVFGLVRAPAAEPAPGAAARVAEPRLASTFAVGEEALHDGAPGVVAPAPEVLGPIDRLDAAVRRGDEVRLDVVLRTRNVGHFFPGGTVDSFDVWVELEVADERGRPVFHSGWVEGGGQGPVEPAAHFYRSLMLDGHGNPINKRNAWMTRSVAYVRLVPPGAADTVRFRFVVPPDAGERLQVRARLNYRKFAWWFNQWAYAGVRDPADAKPDVGAGHDDGRWVFTGDTSRVSGQVKAIPELPITVMAKAEATLRVLPAGAALPETSPVVEAGTRERWNDYGIGLLLAGDLKAAEAAFLNVTRAEPAYADGWINVARARLQEGNLAGAAEMLRKALEISPGLAKAHFFMGLVLKGEGRNDEALEHLQRAAASFPRDRVVLNQLGRVLFLKRRHADAVETLKRVLAIDAEDLAAHYTLMLAQRGLGDTATAARHEALYRRFKADESAQTITGPYRQLHPEDNNERQPVHEHRAGRPVAGAGYGGSR